MKYQQKLIIQGELIDLNAFISACKSHYSVAGRLKSENEEIIVWEAQKQKLKPIDTPCYMAYHWYCKNKRKDKSNVSSMGRKCIEDALQKCHVLKQDNWNAIIGHSDDYYIDKENPRIEIIINYN